MLQSVLNFLLGVTTFFSGLLAPLLGTAKPDAASATLSKAHLDEDLRVSSGFFDSLNLFTPELDLSGQEVSDISWIPTSHPKLKSLKLSKTAVTDLSPLAALVHLRHLDISGTAVTNLTPLATLGLESLLVGSQSLGADDAVFQPLVSLQKTLKKLAVATFSGEDGLRGSCGLQFLSSLQNVEELHVATPWCTPDSEFVPSPEGDPRVQVRMPKLEKLSIESLGKGNCRRFRDLKKLKTGKMDADCLRELLSSERLEELESSVRIDVDLRAIPISSRMRSLVLPNGELDVTENSMAGLARAAPKLEVLVIRRNGRFYKVKNLSFPAFPKLRRLELEGLDVEDPGVAFSSSAKTLEILKLQGVKNVGGLSGFTKLKSLSLKANPYSEQPRVTSAFLAGMKHLEEVHLSVFCLTDLAGFNKMTRLRVLHIGASTDCNIEQDVLSLKQHAATLTSLRLYDFYKVSGAHMLRLLTDLKHLEDFYIGDSFDSKAITLAALTEARDGPDAKQLKLVGDFSEAKNGLVISDQLSSLVTALELSRAKLAKLTVMPGHKLRRLFMDEKVGTLKWLAGPVSETLEQVNSHVHLPGDFPNLEFLDISDCIENFDFVRHTPRLTSLTMPSKQCSNAVLDWPELEPLLPASLTSLGISNKSFYRSQLTRDFVGLTQALRKFRKRALRRAKQAAPPAQ